jgi:hypothetical protein
VYIGAGVHVKVGARVKDSIVLDSCVLEVLQSALDHATRIYASSVYEFLCSCVFLFLCCALLCLSGLDSLRQPHSCVLNSVIGWESRVGEWSRVEVSSPAPMPY